MEAKGNGRVKRKIVKDKGIGYQKGRSIKNNRQYL